MNLTLSDAKKKYLLRSFVKQITIKKFSYGK